MRSLVAYGPPFNDFLVCLTDIDVKNTQDVIVFIPLEKRFGQHGLLQLN